MGKRSAQAGNEVEAGGIRDQSRMAVTRNEARGNAREPDGGNAGMPSVGQQNSLRSKYCCFVEYRCKQTRPDSIFICKSYLACNLHPHKKRNAQKYYVATFRDKFVFLGERIEREAQRENLVQDCKLALRQGA